MPKRCHDGIKKRCTCGPRKWAKCKHGWHFNFHHGGREHRHSLDKVARERGETPPVGRTEAQTWRDRLRNEIRDGVSVQRRAPCSPTDLTFGQLADRYLEKHVRSPGRRDAGRRLMEWYMAALRRTSIHTMAGDRIVLDDKPVNSFITADVEAIRDAWPKKNGCSKGGNVGADRALKRLRHFFNWAIKQGYVDNTPFKRHGVAMISFSRDQARTRRLEREEEAELLAHASPYLRALIVAALETGMRKGELLGLRWRDVRDDAQMILLPAEITKTAEARDVPMTRKLRSVLQQRRHAPDGAPHPIDGFVFGNEVGEQTLDIRDEWAAVCEAAGIRNLHFHDLRREFASRLRETPGVADHHVRDWLGHSDLTTTGRYLATTRVGLQDARKAFERRAAVFAQRSHKRARRASARHPQKVTHGLAKIQR